MNNMRLTYRGLAAAIVCGATLLPVGVASAHTTVQYSNMQSSSDGFYTRAEDMFRQGNYAGTIDQLNRALSLQSSTRVGVIDANDVSDMRCRAMSLLLRAAFERGDETLFNRYYASFMNDYHGTHSALEMQLMQADFMFFKGEYAKAVQAYSALDIDALDPRQADLYRYRLALSQVRTGYFKEARIAFMRLKGVKDYSDASVFYLAYIDYVEGNLRSSRTGFNAVSKSLARELGADYYLAQIDFQEGDFEAVVSASPSLLAGAKSEWVPEINRITGESWYNLGDTERAERFLRDYVGAVDAPQLSSLYDLGVICYDNGYYDEASSMFSRLTSEDDAMSQSAYLYLGQIATREGDYSAAALSFRNAYDIGIDRKVAETALYNYAVAAANGGQIPFGSSSEMLEEFVQRFPESPYAARVDEYLATACFNDNDYEGALRHIERLRHPSSQALVSKQKILFQLGVQAMGRKNYSDAAGYMKQAADMVSKADRSLSAQASLWQGDALYAMRDYSAASAAYSRFVKGVGNSDDNRALGLYNLGYSLYQEKKFSQARKRFNEALSARPSLPARLSSDARLRIADCEYYSGNVSAAMDTYASMASDADNVEADYAAFQHANMLGTTGDNSGKARELQAMLTKYPQSRWRDDARLELVNALCAIDDVTRAVNESSTLLHESPKSPQARKAALAVASAWSESGNNDKAADAYKALVRRWPTSTESEAAVSALKNIYTDDGDLQGFLSFLNSVPEAPRLDASEMDDITFDSALKRVERNPEDMSPLRDYLDKYPTGGNADRALLTIAGNLRERGDNSGALQCINQLLSSRPDSESVPAALMMKGELLEDDGEDVAAAKVWHELLNKGGALYAPAAYSGLMHTSRKPTEVIAYADRLLALGDADKDVVGDALLTKAYALQSLGRNADAIETLQPLLLESATEHGAEAAVLTGEIMLAQNDAKGAEKHLLAFIDSDTPQMYWLARGYIALADTYHALRNDYKAKEYLRALKNNYPGKEADITDMINSRLSKY